MATPLVSDQENPQSPPKATLLHLVLGDGPNCLLPQTVLPISAGDTLEDVKSQILQHVLARLEFHYAEGQEEGLTQILPGTESLCRAQDFIHKQLTPVLALPCFLCRRRKRPRSDTDSSSSSHRNSAKKPMVEEEPVAPVKQEATDDIAVGNIGEDNQQKKPSAAATSNSSTLSAEYKGMRATQRSQRYALGMEAPASNNNAPASLLATHQDDGIMEDEVSPQAGPAVHPRRIEGGQEAAPKDDDTEEEIETAPIEETMEANQQEPERPQGFQHHRYENRYLLNRGQHGIGRLGGGFQKENPQPKAKPWCHHIFDTREKKMRRCPSNDTNSNNNDQNNNSNQNNSSASCTAYPIPKHLDHLRELETFPDFEWNDDTVKAIMPEFSFLAIRNDKAGSCSISQKDMPPQSAGQPIATLDLFPLHFQQAGTACPVFVQRTMSQGDTEGSGWEYCGNYKCVSVVEASARLTEDTNNEGNAATASQSSSPVPQEHIDHPQSSTSQRFVIEFVEYDERVYQFCSSLPDAKAKVRHKTKPKGSDTTIILGRAIHWYQHRSRSAVPTYHNPAGR